MNTLNPLKPKRNVLADHVYDALCDHIIVGKFPSGERLREAQIAEALGVSRTPVREAFAKLERQNLLRKEISGAYFVNEWDQKTLREVATLRSALEELAIQQAHKNLTMDDFARLEEITQQMERALAQSDYNRLITLDIDFHNLLWERSDHGLLQQALEDMKAQILFFMLTTRPGDEEDYPSEHRLIIDALKNGSLQKAQEILRAHILSTAERASARFTK